MLFRGGKVASAQDTRTRRVISFSSRSPRLRARRAPAAGRASLSSSRLVVVAASWRACLCGADRLAGTSFTPSLCVISRSGCRRSFSITREERKDRPLFVSSRERSHVCPFSWPPAPLPLLLLLHINIYFGWDAAAHARRAPQWAWAPCAWTSSGRAGRRRRLKSSSWATRALARAGA